MIITYHRIRNEPKCCNLKMFERQVKAAKKLGFKLTFDDGLLDQYKILPILKRNNTIGTFFIITNVLNKIPDIQKIWLLLKKQGIFKDLNISSKKHLSPIFYAYDSVCEANLKHELRKQPILLNRVFAEQFNEREEIEKLFMNWEQIKELKEEGMQIGNHSHTHQILTDLSYSEKETEIKTSTKILTKKVGKPVCFSYPFGQYDLNCVNLLKQYGYGWAVSTKKRNLFSLNRIDCKEMIL